MAPAGKVNENDPIGSFEPLLNQIEGTIAIDEPAFTAFDQAQGSPRLVQRPHGEIGQELEGIDVHAGQTMESSEPTAQQGLPTPDISHDCDPSKRHVRSLADPNAPVTSSVAIHYQSSLT